MLWFCESFCKKLAMTIWAVVASCGIIQAWCVDRKHGSDYALVTCQTLNMTLTLLPDKHHSDFRLQFIHLCERSKTSQRQKPFSFQGFISGHLNHSSPSCSALFTDLSLLAENIYHSLSTNITVGLVFILKPVKLVLMSTFEPRVKVSSQKLQLIRDYRLWGDQNAASHSVSSYFRGINVWQLGKQDLFFMFGKLWYPISIPNMKAAEHFAVETTFLFAVTCNIYACASLGCLFGY